MSNFTTYLRKLSAMLLAVMMVITPMTPISLAEGEQPVQTEQAAATEAPTPTPVPIEKPTAAPEATATVEPTAEPTATPEATATAEPTTESTATPEATATPEPTATVDPEATPTVEPTLDPEATPTIEPSVTPDPALLLAAPLLDGAGDQIETDTTEVTLIAGDTFTWYVRKVEPYTGSVSYGYTDDDKEAMKALLTLSPNGVQCVFTTKPVTKVETVEVYASSVNADPSTNDSVICTVKILPRPSSFNFVSACMGELNLSAGVAYDSKTDTGYDFSQYTDVEGNLQKRYSFVFASNVSLSTDELALYEDFIRYYSTNINDIKIDEKEGKLTTKTYSKPKVDTKISINLKTPGGLVFSKQAAVTLYVHNNPTSIEITGDPYEIPLGGSKTITYELKDSSGTVMHLDSDAVALTANPGSGISFVGNVMNVGAGASTGNITVTASVVGNDSVNDTCIVTIKGVPTLENLGIYSKPKDGVELVDIHTADKPGEGDLDLSLGETLELYLINNDATKLVTGVEVAGSADAYVRYTVPSLVKTNVYKLTLTGLRLTNGESKVITINVNPDLGSQKVPITLRVSVNSAPSSIKLNKSSYDMCVGDEFYLVAMPQPTTTSTHYTATVGDSSVLSVEEVAYDAEKIGEEYNKPNYKYFRVKALSDSLTSTTVKITSNSGSKPYATCVVTVGNDPVSISIATPQTFLQGPTYQLRPQYVNSKGDKYDGNSFIYASDGGALTLGATTGLLVADSTTTGFVNVTIESSLWEGLLAAAKIKIISADDFSLSFAQQTYALNPGQSMTVEPKANATAKYKYTLTKITSSSTSQEAVTMTVSEDTLSVLLKASATVTGEYKLLAEPLNESGNVISGHSAQCTIVVGAKPKGINVAAGYTTMGLGETIIPEYVLSPVTAVTNGVYYSIEPLTDADRIIKGGYYTNDGGVYIYVEPVTREEGAAVTDDQTKADDITYSKSGYFEGNYIRATKAGWIRVEMRTTDSAHNAGLRKQWLVEIKEAPTGVKFADTSVAKLLCGQSLTRLATVEPSTAYGTVTYKSSNEAVATVDQYGVVTAAKSFTGSEDYIYCRITAKTYNNQQASYDLYVYNQPKVIKLNGVPDDPDANGISLTDTYRRDIGVGETFTIAPEFPSITTQITPTISYTLSEAEYLTKGKQTGTDLAVTGKYVGKGQKVTVSAQNGTTANMIFNIYDKPYKIAFKNKVRTVGLGEDYPCAEDVLIYKTSTVLADAKDKDNTVRMGLKYTSSNEALATVDEDGYIHVVQPLESEKSEYLGKSFVITVESACGKTKNGTSKISCTFTIGEKPTDIQINQTYPIYRENAVSANLVAGSKNEAQFEVAFTPGSASSFINYVIDNEELVTYKSDASEDDGTKALYVYYKTLSTGAQLLCMKPLSKYEGTDSVVFHASTYLGASGPSASLTVNVRGANPPEEDEVEFDPSYITLATGMTTRIAPKLTDAAIVAGKSADFEFFSSNTSYFTINKITGLLTAKRSTGSGTQTVKVMWDKDASGRNQKSKELIIRIVNAPSAILFKRLAADKTTVTETGLKSMTVYLTANESYTLRYYFSPDDAISNDVSIVPVNAKLNDYASATLDVEKDSYGNSSGGVITIDAKAIYSTYIKFNVTSKVGNSTKTAQITVYVKGTPDSISLNPNQVTLAPGDVYKGFKATVLPTNAGGVTYFSCDANSAISELNAHTGVVTIKDKVAAKEVFNVYARSTGLKGRPDDTSNTSTITVLRSIIAKDIQGEGDDDSIIFYKGTEQRYSQKDFESKKMCVGDVLELTYTFPDVTDYTKKYPLIFEVDPYDKAYLSVSTAGKITALQATPAGVSASVYVRPSNSTDMSDRVELQFNIADKPTSLKVYTGTTEFVETLSVKAGDTLLLQGDDSAYKITFKVFPEASDGYSIISAYSSNKAIANIVKNDAGNWQVEAYKRGTVKIYFTTSNGKLKATPFTVVVYTLPTEILASPDEITLGEGMSQTITGSYYPATSKTGYPDADYKINMEPGSGYDTMVSAIRVDDTNQFVVTALVSGNEFGSDHYDTAKVRVTSDDTARLYDVYTDVNVKILKGPQSVEFTNAGPGSDNEKKLANLGVGEYVDLQYKVTAPEGGFNYMKSIETFMQDNNIGSGKTGGCIKWSKRGGYISADNGQSRIYTVRVTAVTKGATEFSVNYSNEQGAKVTINVVDSLSKVSLLVPSTTIKLVYGETFTFKFCGPTPSSSVRNSFTLDRNYNQDLITATQNDTAMGGEVTVVANSNGKKGSTRVTIRAYNGKSASVTFVVSDPVNNNASKAAISISPSRMTIKEGYLGKINYSLKYIASGKVTFYQCDADGDPNNTPSDLTLLSTEWEGASTGYICPALDGLYVNTVGYIRASVDYTDADGNEDTVYSNIIPITVQPGPQENPLTNTLGIADGGAVEIGLGESVNLRYYQDPLNKVYRYYTSFTYQSDDVKVATVNGSGTIKGVGLTSVYGNAGVTMRALNGRNVTAAVTVKRAPLKVLLNNLTDGVIVVTTDDSGSFDLSGNVLFDADGRSDEFASYNTKFYSSHTGYAKVVGSASQGYKLQGVKETGNRSLYLTVRTFNGKTAKYKVVVTAD